MEAFDTVREVPTHKQRLVSTLRIEVTVIEACSVKQRLISIAMLVAVKKASTNIKRHQHPKGRRDFYLYTEAQRADYYCFLTCPHNERYKFAPAFIHKLLIKKAHK
jgi:hypothetical protein